MDTCALRTSVNDRLSGSDYNLSRAAIGKCSPGRRGNGFQEICVIGVFPPRSCQDIVTVQGSGLVKVPVWLPQ